MTKLLLTVRRLLPVIESSGKIIAVGKEANMMQGKTHENIKDHKAIERRGYCRF